MPGLTKISLLAVVFVDLLGQGLVFPIITTLLLDPATGFLPPGATAAQRELSYGLIIGIFFLSWFLGASYISRISDLIGRKNAILICLFGAFFGYVLTIVAVAINSFGLLIVGRAISGFTAGNQPIAQAAMIDMSRSDAERARNMGYVVAGISGGMVAGPIIGGVLSDEGIIGDLASVSLPFYAALALVGLTIVMIFTSFHDTRLQRQKFRFNPLQVFTLMAESMRRPVIRRMSAVFIAFMISNMSFFIFIDNYLTARFGIGLFGISMAMVVLGIAMASASTFCVAPALKRFSKGQIVAGQLVLMALCLIAFFTAEVAWPCFLAVFLFYFGFGIAYPVMLGMFSAAVGEDEQGWIMGITTAQFTLTAGVMSLIGGTLMGIDIRLPFLIGLVAAVLGLAIMALLWKQSAFREATQMQGAPGAFPSAKVQVSKK